MKTVWIINQYASDPETGIGGRHHNFGRELAARGVRVFVIAASWHHLLIAPSSNKAPPLTADRHGYTSVRIPVPPYAGAHGKGRIRNWFLFRHRLWALRKTLPAPDVILYSSPGIIAFPAAARLARHFKARLAFEVRDIWPLSLVEVGGLSARHPLIRYMQRIEDHAYRVCDVAISNLSHAESHMRRRGLGAGRFHFIPNGIDMAEVRNPAPLEDKIRAQIPQCRFIVGYTGTLGLANKTNVLLSAAKILKDDPDIAVVLVGGGKEKPELMKQTARDGLRNVVFIDPIPKAQIQSMLGHFDACFVGAAQSPLYRFGIAANKIYDYLFAGRPLVMSYSGAGDPATAYGAGLTATAEDPEALAAIIRQLKALPQDCRDRMGARGHRAALEHHDYTVIAAKLEQVLFADAGQPS